MRSLSATQRNNILSKLDAGHPAHTIASTTGIHVSTISRLRSKDRSEAQKSTRGHPSKLSPTNVHHAIHLISTCKGENAVQVTKALTNIINQPLHPNTVHQHLKKSGMKAVVKSKHPLLSVRHRKAQLDFTYAHKDWTVEDWKKVVWSDETKINPLPSNFEG
jgi:IS30 family transposase